MRIMALRVLELFTSEMKILRVIDSGREFFGVLVVENIVWGDC